MKLKNTILAFSSALLFGANASLAQSEGTIDGNTLYEACLTDNAEKQGFCIGYIIGYREGRKWGTFLMLSATGIADEMASGDADALGDRFAGNCMPASVPYSQVRDIAVKYMRDNPEDRHESARVLIWASLVEAFPCE